MKHILTACAAFGAVILPASASPDLAGMWGVKAGDLYQQTVQLMQDEQRRGADGLPDPYIHGLERFALTATRLGTWQDETQSSADLGCIFRGMAEETELQLDVLETAVESEARQAAYRRLTAMFDDAQLIAAAAQSSQSASAQKSEAGPKPCPANPEFLKRLSAD